MPLETAVREDLETPESGPHVSDAERIERLEQAVAALTHIVKISVGSLLMRTDGFVFLQEWAIEGARIATDREYQRHYQRQAVAEEQRRREAESNRAKTPLHITTP